MELCLLFTISVDHFPKASKWDGINRSVSLPGSQAFCYIPSQPGKAAYLKINFKISPKTPTVNHSFLYFIQCHWNKKGLSKKGDKNDHREWILMSKQKYMLTEFEVRRAGFYRCSASNWKIWPWASKMLYLLTIPALQHTFNPNVVIQSFWNLFLSL